MSLNPEHMALGPLDNSNFGDLAKAIAAASAIYMPAIVLCLFAVIGVELLAVLAVVRYVRSTSQERTAKTLIVLGSGGHTAEMLKLVEALDKQRYAPRAYIVAGTDVMSGRKAAGLEAQLALAAAAHAGAGAADSKDFKQPASPRGRRKSAAATEDKTAALMAAASDPVAGTGPATTATPAFELIEIPRSREVGQSYITSVWTTLVALLYSFHAITTIKPDVVLLNGPGTCIPVAVAAWLFRAISASPCSIVYVESIARTRKLSLSARILYHLRMTDALFVQWKELLTKYPRAAYAGRLY